MHDHPLAGLLLEDDGPAQRGQFVLAAVSNCVFLDGRRSPGQIAIGVYLGIVVYREFYALVVLQQVSHTLLVLRPIAVPQRGDVKEGVFALVIILGHAGRIARTPTRHEFLQIGFVRRAGSRGLLL